MTNVLRFLQFLALGIWLGGIIFLSFVEAPGVFSILSSREQAGSIVGYSLTRLHYIGIVAAIVYVLAGVVRSPRTLIHPAVILVVLMLALTLVSEFGVRPRMAVLRAQMDSAESSATQAPVTASAGSEARASFDRLHRASVQLEGATLLIGLVGLFLTARKS